ncbi:hypothetical protein N8I71_13415 [Roseibacterium sp. SDUM158016]|uniref:hypothetical protein n=1 Tax=Roseicyclus sediminis TaxID=2980997 RepID=UPI0021CFBEEB|nr:hypothetical protein [Roseibacterium sp. SDUM158016]MCU4653838.1 hypothetical protein [Roseibacterium sp. SDUM158016]
MDHSYRYHSRPGSLWLSLLALVGLILLAAQLWEIMPGFVMLVFIPALLVSIAQLVMTPVYGLFMSDRSWRIEAGKEARELEVDKIAYLRLQERGPRPRTFVVLSDGSEVEMPQVALPDPLVLIREATNRGVPVRHA